MTNINKYCWLQIYFKAVKNINNMTEVDHCYKLEF